MLSMTRRLSRGELSGPLDDALRISHVRPRCKSLDRRSLGTAVLARSGCEPCFTNSAWRETRRAPAEQHFHRLAQVEPCSR